MFRSVAGDVYGATDKEGVGVGYQLLSSRSCGWPRMRSATGKTHTSTVASASEVQTGTEGQKDSLCLLIRIDISYSTLNTSLMVWTLETTFVWKNQFTDAQTTLATLCCVFITRSHGYFSQCMGYIFGKFFNDQYEPAKTTMNGNGHWLVDLPRSSLWANMR